MVSLSLILSSRHLDIRDLEDNATIRHTRGISCFIKQQSFWKTFNSNVSISIFLSWRIWNSIHCRMFWFICTQVRAYTVYDRHAFTIVTLRFVNSQLSGYLCILTHNKHWPEAGTNTKLAKCSAFVFVPWNEIWCCFFVVPSPVCQFGYISMNQKPARCSQSSLPSLFHNLSLFT